MGNEKEYTQIGEQLIQTGQVGSGNTLVQETVIEPIIPELEPIIQEEIKEAPARIPNALFSSLLSTREYTNLKSLERLGIDIKNKDIKEGVDEEGKPIRLTKLQDRILLALSAEFSRYRNEPKIKKLIERTEKGDSFNNEDTDTLIRLYIDLEELTGKVLGAKERGKTAKQDLIHKELKKISEIRQLCVFKIKQKVNTEYKDLSYKEVDYYFVLTGGTKEIVVDKDKDKRKKKLEIIFGRVFYERLDSRAILLPDEYWELKDSKGRKISTTIFTDLTKEVFKLRWSHIYYDLPKAEALIKKEGILDNEAKERIIKSALTHIIKEDKIKEITNADYTSTRKRKADFWIDLWEALRAFIVLGVLTQETEINKEEGSIKLVYNTKYEQGRKGIENIEIGYWYNNPFKK